MERMNDYRGNRQHANSSSSGPPLNTAQPAGDGGGGNTIREQDQYMPIANVIRIMRRILPPHAKISDDAKETIQECVSEYISFVTGEANDRCQREQRKTVTAEDVLWAMAKLGFDDYVQPLSLYLNRYRASNNSDGISSGGSSGVVDNVARRGIVTGGGGVDHHPYGGYGIGPGQYHPRVFIDPMTGYYPVAGGGPGWGSGSAASGSGQNGGVSDYDPFAQFK